MSNRRLMTESTFLSANHPAPRLADDGSPPDEPAPPRIYLRTFGSPALLRISPGDRQEVALEPSKLLALLTYLAFAPARVVTRDHLIDLLWANLDPDAARHALRHHLWELRRRVGSAVQVAGRDQLALRTALDSDREQFVRASEHGMFARALDLYGGDFFPGFAASGAAEFEHWVESERADLSARFLRCAEFVLRDQLNAHRHREAVATARRIRNTDPLRQQGWRLLLEALVASGDYLSAAVECEALERLTRAEGMALEQSTQKLVAMAQRVSLSAGEREPTVLQVELVGREQEFALLTRAWESTCRGRPTRVTIMAHAGLGKTRLLTEFRTRLQSRRARHIIVRCNAGTAGVPYALAGDLAERLGRLPGAIGVAPQAMQILVALSPALSGVFSATPHVSLPADVARHRMVALRELVATVASEQPLAILIDDMHWGDEASRLLLVGLMNALDDSPVLLCSTTREADAGLPAAQVVGLQPLTVAALETLIASVGSLPRAQWADHLPGELLRRTSGVPLYVIEFLQLALQEGILTLTREAWGCEDPERLWDLLRSGEVLHRRLERLELSERQLLTTLAVAATPLDETLLSAASGLADESARSALVALRLKGLVSEGSGAPGMVHDEVAALVSAGLSRGQRREIEHRLGEALARLPYSEPKLRRLAAALLYRANAIHQLEGLFRAHLADSRRHGDRRRVRAVAAELVGGDVPDSVVGYLAGSVGLFDRLRSSWPARVAISASLALGAAGLAFGFWAGNARSPADGILHVATRSADGGRVVSVPLRRSSWPVSGALMLDSRPRVALQTPRHWAAAPTRSPDGASWAAHVDVADSGDTELFLFTSRGRGVRRLTFSPGDDVDPTWSPDGRQLAFSTARWDSSGHPDIAALDVRTGAIRRITSDAASDLNPRWSPDGTRIAFLRRPFDSDSPEGICVISVDGIVQRCAYLGRDESGAVVDWDSDTTFLVRHEVPGRTTTSRFRDLDWTVRRESTWAGAVLAVTAGGTWLVSRCQGQAPWSSERYCVAPDGRADLARPLAAASGALPDQVAVSADQGSQYLDRIELLNLHGTPVVGVPFVVEIRGADAGGSPMPVRALRVRSLDVGRATVDSLGSVVAHRAGPLMLEVTAGGWRQDTVVLRAVASPDSVLLEERWAELSGAWRPFGIPLPEVTIGEYGEGALYVAGDGVYHSGAYLARTLDGRAGLRVRARVSTPITNRQWQYLSITLATGVNRAALSRWDHRTGYLWGVKGVDGFGTSCAAFYPPPTESRGARDSLQVRGRHGDRRVLMPERVRSGQWYDLVIQYFPDGRCGVAVDGVPLAIAHAAGESLDRVTLAVFGNSAATRILVGALEVRQGVDAGVDWSAVPPR